MYRGRCVLSIWLLIWSIVQTMAQMSCPQSAGHRCNKVVDENKKKSEYKFTVDGNNFFLKGDGVKEVSLECNGNLTLDNSALPRFDKLSNYSKVKLYGCTPGQHTYAEALQALNIQYVNISLFINGTNGLLTKKQFTGLDDIKELELLHLNLTDDALQTISKLQNLNFTNMSLPSMKLLPNSLTVLELKYPGLVELQKDDFKNLNKLELFSIYEEKFNVSVNGIDHVKYLAITAPFVSLGPELSNTLESVEIHGWGSEKPEPWLMCNKMVNLTILKAEAVKLPNGWIANCSSLRKLEIKNAFRLTLLKSDPFQGARNLEILKLTHNALHELPSWLLNDLKNLKELDLSGNYLVTLERSLFLNNYNLKELNLSGNNFNNAVYKNIPNNLTKLDLSYNKLIFRYARFVSGHPLSNFRNLSELRLRGMDMSFFFWEDWHYCFPNLIYLDLSDNLIPQLQIKDIEFTTNITINLTGNNIAHLIYSATDISNLNESYCKSGGGQAEEKRPAKIELSCKVQWGCEESWAALALRKYLQHITLNWTCTGGRNLSEVSFDRLACPAEQEYCPEKCNCRQILRDVDLCQGDPVRVINVTCTNLSELPKLKNDSEVAWNLALAHNRITSPRAQDLPWNVLEIDLRHNGITQVKDITSLTSPGRRLLLEGNKLDCTCDAEQALADLISKRTLINDFLNLTCSNGGPLKVDCRWNKIIPITLSVTPMLLIVIAVIICLVHPTSRAMIVFILRAFGCISPPPEPNQERPFDVFLSFSHQDFKIVESIKSWLEDCKKPYRTLVHYRDWTPGYLIAEQIEASVRFSQRTVAVISRHFLESDWARAEFREAFQTALVENEPRLIVVLLEDPDNLSWGQDVASNNMLRRYIRNKTYLRWGDIWFWQKLRAALPAPRGKNKEDSMPLIRMMELSPRIPDSKAVTTALVEESREVTEIDKDSSPKVV